MSEEAQYEIQFDVDTFKDVCEGVGQVVDTSVMGGERYWTLSPKTKLKRLLSQVMVLLRYPHKYESNKAEIKKKFRQANVGSITLPEDADDRDKETIKQYQIDIGAIFDYIDWRSEFAEDVGANFLGGIGVEFVVGVYNNIFRGNGYGSGGTVSVGRYGENYGGWRDRVSEMLNKRKRKNAIFVTLLLCVALYIGALTGVVARQYPHAFLSKAVSWAFFDIRTDGLVTVGELSSLENVNLARYPQKSATWSFHIPENSTYYLSVGISATNTQDFQLSVYPEDSANITQIDSSRSHVEYILSPGRYNMDVVYAGNMWGNTTFTLNVQNNRNLLCVKRISERYSGGRLDLRVGTVVIVTGASQGVNNTGLYTVLVPLIESEVDYVPRHVLGHHPYNKYPDCELFGLPS